MSIKRKLVALYIFGMIATMVGSYLIIKNSNIKTRTVTLTLQYVDSCCLTKEIKDSISVILKEFPTQIIYNEVEVKTDDFARSIKFRGSPTLILDSIDVMGMDEPKNPTLSCRTYPKGLPNLDFLREKVKAGLSIHKKLKKRIVQDYE